MGSDSVKKSVFALGLYFLMGGIGSCAQPEESQSVQSWQMPKAALDELAYPSFLVDARGAEAYRQAGLAARQQDDFETAIATLKTAVALDPTHVPGYVLLGWTQHLAAQRQDAIATLNKGLSMDAEHIPALNALGIAYLVDGNLEAAIATHTKAKTLNPENEIAHYNLSLAYQRLPDLPAAIAHASRATELEPFNPHPWVALALAHWSNQNIDEAQAAYRQALALDGRYYDAYHLSNLIRAGFSDEQVQQVDALRTQI